MYVLVDICKKKNKVGPKRSLVASIDCKKKPQKTSTLYILKCVRKTREQYKVECHYDIYSIDRKQFSFDENEIIFCKTPFLSQKVIEL